MFTLPALNLLFSWGKLLTEKCQTATAQSDVRQLPIFNTNGIKWYGIIN